MMPRDDPSHRSTSSKHLPQIIRKGFRFFIGCKVSTSSMFRLEHDIQRSAEEPTQRFALSLGNQEGVKRERLTL